MRRVLSLSLSVSLSLSHTVLYHIFLNRYLEKKDLEKKDLEKKDLDKKDLEKKDTRNTRDKTRVKIGRDKETERETPGEMGREEEWEGEEEEKSSKEFGRCVRKRGISKIKCGSSHLEQEVGTRHQQGLAEVALDQQRDDQRR